MHPYNEETNEDELPDPLIEEDEEAYNTWKENVSKQIYTLTEGYDLNKHGLLMDGNFIVEKEQEVSLEIFDLLQKVKRLPEVVFFLSADLDKIISRVVDEKEIKKN